MLIYAVTIFLSAFLLFQVEPLIAKFILPWFGGSAAVWSAALLFFQLLLLAGYFYAHVLIRYLSAKRQLWLHVVLLGVSLASLPIIPRASLKPSPAADPTLQILLLLGATVGLPYMLLAATSPLLQAWYVRMHAGAIPYRLFALSNLGSMLALLSYPLIVEPRLALSHQALIWSGGYAVFAGICAFAGWKSRAGMAKSLEEGAAGNVAQKAPAPAAGTMIFWVALAACASALLLATTSHLTQNVAPIPLLWVVPLSLYLLSFILCFESDRLYQRWLFIPLLVAALGVFGYGVRELDNNWDIRYMIPALCAALFVCCMVCHGELARRKPHPRYLTQFYLMVAVGGAAGGLFVALAAPHIFRSYLEMPIAVGGCALLAAAALWRTGSGAPRALWIRTALAVSVAAFAVFLGITEYRNSRPYLLTARNFYGVLRVRDEPPDDGVSVGVRVLIHGTINHGTEILAPGSGRVPTSYFGRDSGISRAIRAKQEKGPIRIGILGLGAGVTASLARAVDTLHYYEINPLVVDIAKAQFSFLRSCPAHKRIFMGDGRLVLEGLPSEQLDFLAMDAFSSDAVPLHLLTREAYQIYRRHLKPDGVLAVNISNRYLNLAPIVAESAAEIGWSGVIVYDEGYGEDYYTASTWIILSPQQSFFNNPDFQDASVSKLELEKGFRPWTDDYSNIIQILNR
jgi:SAM-dependent methyltransferase